MAITSLGRHIRRIPVHVWVAWSGWVSRAVTAVVGLLTVRLLVQALGAENYAVYAILGSVHGWCLLADFGLGASLQNHISEQRTRGENYSHLVFMTALTGCVLILITSGILFGIGPPLAELLLKEFPGLSAIEKARDFLLLGELSLVTALGGITYNIWFAEQKGYLANLFPAAASLLGFCGVLLVSWSSLQDKLWWSILAAYGPLGMIPVLSLAWYLARKVKPGRLTLRGGSALFGRAFKFWIFALMSAGVLQIDYLLMSQFLPAREIVVYNLASKVFMLVFFLYSAILTAIWPVFAELAAQQKWGTIKSYLRRYIFLGTLLVIVFTLGFSAGGSLVVRLLAPGQGLVIPGAFVFLLGGYFLLRVWSDTFSVALFSMSYLRPFFLYIPIQALLSFCLQWLLIPHLGIYGVTLGVGLSFLLTAAWVLPLSFSRRALALGARTGETGCEE